MQTNQSTTPAITTERTWNKAGADAWLGLWGWNSFMTALRETYLRDDTLPALIDDPSIPKASLSHCYVNLALVESVLHASQEKTWVGDGESALERGDVYRELLDGETIEIEGIFNPVDLERRVATVLSDN